MLNLYQLIHCGKYYVSIACRVEVKVPARNHVACEDSDGGLASATGYCVGK